MPFLGMDQAEWMRRRVGLVQVPCSGTGVRRNAIGAIDPTLSLSFQSLIPIVVSFDTSAVDQSV